MVRLFFILFFASVNLSTSYSQNNLAAKSVSDINNRYYAISDNIAKELFNSVFYDDFGYLVGRQYQPYNSFGHSSPFLDNKQGIGTVFSNGKAYSNLKLRYDIYLDLLINTPKLVSYGSLFITINKSAIDSFTININSYTYNIKNLHFPEGTKAGMKDGFYETYRCGNSLFLIKHKAIVAKLQGYPEYKYSPIKYLYKNDDYYRINSRGDLLRLYPENKKTVKQKIKSYITPYRTLKDHQIAEIIQFAESL